MGRHYPAVQPFSHKFGHLWVVLLGGSGAAWALVMGLSNLLIFGGLILMWRGWKLIHGARGELVTSGPYRLVRHPQYSAFFLMTMGFLIQWPTLITVVMWPILMFVYYRLALREERDMAAAFGDRYHEYAARTPRFMPAIRGLFHQGGAERGAAEA